MFGVGSLNPVHKQRGGGGGAESCAQTAEEIKNYRNACLRGKGNKFVVILTAPFCRPLPMSNDVEMTSY